MNLSFYLQTSQVLIFRHSILFQVSKKVPNIKLWHRGQNVSSHSNPRKCFWWRWINEKIELSFFVFRKWKIKCFSQCKQNSNFLFLWDIKFDSVDVPSEKSHFLISLRLASFPMTVDLKSIPDKFPIFRVINFQKREFYCIFGFFIHTLDFLLSRFEMRFLRRCFKFV